MLTSIGKFSKSFFIKLLVGIIILPFVFWGMGDVFRGGNQNVIATIDSKKISTQEFINYLRKLNLNKEQIDNLPRTDLIEKILSEYIGKKVMEIEIEKLGISINDNALRDIIKNDKLFYKDDKFSRTEYEKFLLKSGISAPIFEANIVEQEKRRQFLSLLSGGIVIPDEIVNKEFRKENQIKTIKYIDLEKYHSQFKASDKSKKELYERNKNVFFDEFKSIRYAEITPKLLSGSNEYDENFFKQLDIIENEILDGKTFSETAQSNNLDIILIQKINAKKEDQNKNKLKEISNNLFKEIFKLKSTGSTKIISTDKKYYLVELADIEKTSRPINDPEVQEALNAQFNRKRY